MFRNYLITALRNLTRHRLHSFINIAGLAIGLACVTFIALFVRDELSYDGWIPNSVGVYRLETTWSWPGAASYRSAYAPFPLAEAMQISIPEVQDTTRVVPEDVTVKSGDRLFPEAVDFVDPNFFTVIELPLLTGEAGRVLGPDSVVLSQRMARKYFGDSDPLGKTLVVENKYALQVSGIVRDPPHNSAFQDEFYVSNKSRANPFTARTNWFDDGETYLYVRLLPGGEPAAALDKVRALLRKNMDPSSIIKTQMSGDQLMQARLERLADMHLSGEENGNNQPGSWYIVYGFAAIGALILAVACFNFTNLATAHATLRAREVSIRKVMGGKRRQLIAQFLGESVLTALAALFVALALVEILLPQFNSLLGSSVPLAFNYLMRWPLTLGMIGIAILAGLLSGAYPALVLSNFRPAATLRTSRGQSGSGRLRTVLVILQFTISIGLGVAALVVFAQIRYARQIDLGFNRDNIVVLEGVDHLTSEAVKSLKQTLASGSDVISVARSSTIPFDALWQATSVYVPGGQQAFSSRIISVEPDFFRVYDMHLLAGRWLSTDQGDDLIEGVQSISELQADKNILINAEEARKLGSIATEAVGMIVQVGKSHSPARIVGVVDNAKFYGAHDAVDPIVYVDKPNMTYVISVHVKGGHIPEALAFIDKTWSQFAPSLAIRRHFLDDSFDKLFTLAQRQGEMFAIFVAIAIVIACLGLFGLAAFTVERRTKEIGLRKAFGARNGDIVLLLLWQFSIPVLLANLIAAPVAAYYLRNWLDSYAFRIPLSPLYFIAAGLCALIIAWITVFAHALRVARASPVLALRYE